MSYKLLTKGLEIELFAGKESGEILPLSDKLSQNFSFVSEEPDKRNFEYITNPVRDYEEFIGEIIQPRIKIRKYLKNNGHTLIPGSTMALPFSKEFYFSKKEDPYHQFIQDSYKTNIITTSLHLNFGIENTELLFKLLAALRLDTPLILALSASSPFYDGKVTGFNSFRWHLFPKNPEFVPIFNNHNEYINWTNKLIKNKTLYNVRHLWTSIRPNGPERPFNLNRIEIRISDLVSDISKAVAIIALIEALIQNYLYTEKWPNILQKNETRLHDIAKLIQTQEELAAKDGLNAVIWDWRKDSQNKASLIIENLCLETKDIIKKLNISKYIKPVFDILNNGNEATLFLQNYNKSKSIATTIQHFIKEFNNMDLKYGSMTKTH